MTNEWQQQAEQIVEQGKQAAAGMVSGGEMLIDAEPDNGLFRVKLRNVQPSDVTPQLVSGFCYVLANAGSVFNLQVKQRIQEGQDGNND